MVFSVLLVGPTGAASLASLRPDRRDRRSRNQPSSDRQWSVEGGGRPGMDRAGAWWGHGHHRIASACAARGRAESEPASSPRIPRADAPRDPGHPAIPGATRASSTARLRTDRSRSSCVLPVLPCRGWQNGIMHSINHTPHAASTVSAARRGLSARGPKNEQERYSGAEWKDAGRCGTGRGRRSAQPRVEILDFAFILPSIMVPAQVPAVPYRNGRPDLQTPGPTNVPDLPRGHPADMGMFTSA